MTLRSGGLFAGYGGLDMAVAEIFGAEPAWFSEIEPGPSKILAHHWPTVPNHGDITTIDWDQVEPVDILSGGFPCQDVSAAGKRAGMHPDTRSGLWNHFAYAISKLRPRYVVAENVRGLLSAEAHSDVEPCPWCLGEGSGEPDLRALGAVLGDLADLGYDARWCGLRAADIGAPHGRYRVFILATDAGRLGSERGRVASNLGSATTGGEGEGLQRKRDRDTPRHRGAATSDPQIIGHERGWAARNWRPGLADGDRTPANTDNSSRNGRQREQVGEAGGGATAAGGSAAAAWAQYAGAIERWERVLGRPAPAPTEQGTRGGQRLAPRFVEWMMGLPDGHVTAVPGVNRNAQLKALGNGVVPQQAIAALQRMHATNQLLATA
jgi:DNA (cytosine-5)-methyltransferase 1